MVAFCLSAQDGCQVTSVNLKNTEDKEIRDDKIDSLGSSSAESLTSVGTADKSYIRAWSTHTIFRLNLKLPTNMGINLICQALRICAALMSILNLSSLLWNRCRNDSSGITEEASQYKEKHTKICSTAESEADKEMQMEI